MDMPTPTKEDIKKDNKSQWCKDLKNILSKYVSNSWRNTWANKVEIWLSLENRDDLWVDLNLDKGAGIFRWGFRLK